MVLFGCWWCFWLLILVWYVLGLGCLVGLGYVCIVMVVVVVLFWYCCVLIGLIFGGWCVLVKFCLVLFRWLLWWLLWVSICWVVVVVLCWVSLLCWLVGWCVLYWWFGCYGRWFVLVWWLFDWIGLLDDFVWGCWIWCWVGSWLVCWWFWFVRLM